ncbi:hypothetical protein [Clostridium tyrobutyricum]|nr:hypothetical protein [Clostridium tyrobutyricum]
MEECDAKPPDLKLIRVGDLAYAVFPLLCKKPGKIVFINKNKKTRNIAV